MAVQTPDEVTKRIDELKGERVPADLSETLIDRLKRIQEGQVPFNELERQLEYIDWVVSLPWEDRTKDILDLPHTKEVLNTSHYGLASIKERILEYIAIMQLRASTSGHPRAPLLCFVGLVGTGKTTMAASIANALGRTFVRIPLGGLGEVATLRGTPRFETSAEPGAIIKSLKRAKAKNPVILLDEIDRVAEAARASVMGALVEILDPEQNSHFIDAYIDYPFDLSEIFFIASANNTTNIATAVLDRLEIVEMPSYTDEEKMAIGRDFILPRILDESGVSRDALTLSPTVWPLIVRPLGYDAGMRTLERTIQAIVRKVAKEIVEGKTKSVQINETTLEEYVSMW
ncbi:AAA family ATPase [Candidatus Microgenomates bacterium]|nr:AAA family ATPase [Candidatus Microgenomates bacterium]